MEEKNNRKLCHAANYNLAILYLHTEQFQLANDLALRLIEIDYDKGDGKKIQKEIENNIASLRLQNLSSRHFPRN